jgi:hypothetical protein
LLHLNCTATHNTHTHTHARARARAHTHTHTHTPVAQPCHDINVTTSVTAPRYNVSVLNEDPLIYQFEDFLTAEECDGIAALAAGRFQKSTTGLNRDRTLCPLTRAAYFLGHALVRV